VGFPVSKKKKRKSNLRAQKKRETWGEEKPPKKKIRIRREKKGVITNDQKKRKKKKTDGPRREKPDTGGKGDEGGLWGDTKKKEKNKEFFTCFWCQRLGKKKKFERGGEGSKAAVRERRLLKIGRKKKGARGAPKNQTHKKKPGYRKKKMPLGQKFKGRRLRARGGEKEKPPPRRLAHAYGICEQENLGSLGERQFKKKGVLATKEAGKVENGGGPEFGTGALKGIRGGCKRIKSTGSRRGNPIGPGP